MQANTITQDNINIAMNYYANGHEEIVIVAPGWCMTKDSKAFLGISQMFAEFFDVITFDFRGHGKSKGFFTFIAKELFDIEAVLKFTENKNYKKIYLAGFSLGAAIVLICAAKHKNIDKVIAVSPPSDFSKIEIAMWKKEAWAETFKKFELDRFLSLRMSLLPRKKVKPVDIIGKITAPTLFIAGGKDPTVYPWHTKLLYERANCEKQFKLFENGYHSEDLYLYFKEEFSNLCIEWLNK